MAEVKFEGLFESTKVKQVLGRTLAFEVQEVSSVAC